ncbi:MAG: putative DNA-binding domain-containing protein [Gammaproteobacteria bacterium]|nr:putative DNA-binding domain-containing protein [Gammaproteobacteria bacterium]
MRSLPDLQRSFTEFLLSPPGTRVDPVLSVEVRGQRVPVEKRLAIYKNNVYAQLIGALRDSYPAVHRLVGHDFFRFAAMEYIRAHPSRSPTLLEYGASFPEFLGGFEAASSVPYLPDVARLEQLYLESYHAPEAAPLPKAECAVLLSDGSAQLRLHTSARLMTSSFPVSRIWEVNVRPAVIDGRIQIPGGAEYLLIVRPHTTVEVRRISSSTHAALAALERGCSVAEALAAGTDIDPGIDLPMHLLSLADGDTFCSCENQ